MLWVKRSVNVFCADMGAFNRQRSNSFLALTRQTWKMYAFFALLVVSGGSFVLMLLALGHGGTSIWLLDDVSLALITAITGVGAVAWLFVSLRCPSCRDRVAAHIITREAPGEWLPKLMGLTQCPRCGSRGSGSRP